MFYALVGATVLLAGVTLAVRRKLKRCGIIRQPAQGPLVGVKVVDLSVVIAAPWAAAQMAELGAEVIKVESMELPDSARGLGPAPVRGFSSMFLSTGRGKRSICLNLKTDDGLAVLHLLISQCDVLIQNYRPGAADRMGLGYEKCMELKPSLIYVSSSGFGPTGPYSHRRIYDPLIQCISGMARLSSWSPDPPVQTLMGSSICDKLTALTSLQAILAALEARERGAGGQHLQTSMLDASFQFLWCDGYRDATWPGARPDRRMEGEAAGIDLIPGANAEHHANHARGSGHFPTNREVMQDPSVVREHLLPPESSLRHILFGGCNVCRHPCTFSETPTWEAPIAPFIGEHTVGILHELGFSGGEVRRMLRDGSASSTASILQYTMNDPTKAKVFKLLESLQGGARALDAAAKPSARGKTRAPSFSSFVDGPLTGRVVIEIGSLVAAPLAAMLMADQGATVIKVESELAPDPSRRFGTRSTVDGGGAGSAAENQSLFVTLNRNKKGVSVHPRTGKKQILALIATADVLIVESGEAEAFGLDVEEARRANKDLICVRIDKGGGELAVQTKIGVAGVHMSPSASFRVAPPTAVGASASAATPEQKDDAAFVTNVREQLKGSTPSYVKQFLCEKITGLEAAAVACAALYARSRRLSRGQLLEMSMERAVLHSMMLDNMWNDVWHRPKAPASMQEFHTLFLCHPSKDGPESGKPEGWFFSAVISDKEWREFRSYFEEELKQWPHYDELIGSGKWDTISARFGMSDQLVGLSRFINRRYSASEIMEFGEKAGVPVAQVLSPEEALRDPQVKHARIVRSVEHPTLGAYHVSKPAVSFGGTPSREVLEAAPTLGQHNEGILGAL
jgi:crotonobetainyl-CoA:carnitine CoA-transferase CaiB-like acyl-CoA transferase